MGTCPKCGKTFHRLGHHFQHSPECGQHALELQRRQNQQQATSTATTTKCPHCHMTLKRPMSHFSRSRNCYLHFLQIQREHALSSQQEQHDDDMLDFLVDTSPAMPPASNTSEALSEGFRTVPSHNSKGQTVSRKTSTRSLSSAGRRNKKQHGPVSWHLHLLAVPLHKVPMMRVNPP